MLRIFRHYVPASAVLLFLCEGAVMVLVLLALAQGVAPAATSDATASPDSTAMLAAVIVASVLMYSIGLYDRLTMASPRRAMPRLITMFVICTSVTYVAMMFAGRDASHAETAVLWAAAFSGVFVARLGYAALAKTAFTPRRILVVGVGKLAAEIEYLNSRRQRSQSEVIGYAALGGQAPEVSPSRIMPVTSSVLDLARATGAKEIVVALDDRRGVPSGSLLDARMNGITVTSHLAFWEREARRVCLKGLDASWLIYSDGFRVGTVSNAILKRLLDIVASLGVLVFTLPTLIIAAVAIRVDGAGPVFYRQERVGRHGRPFTIYKFRTMRLDAESDGVPRWAAALDARITRIGWLLRLTHIDELPQLWNVLRGDMSFVGPRPERPFFVKMLCQEIPFYSERHRVRPGITGWAQINHPYGASIEDAKAKLSYDLYYIKNYSLLFDFLTILSTVRAVFLATPPR